MEETIKQRLSTFIESLGISVNKFEKTCSLSQGFVKNIGKNIGSVHLGKILHTYPQLSQQWILTGEGTMLRVDATSLSYEEASQKDELSRIRELQQKVSELQEQVDELKADKHNLSDTIKALKTALELANQTRQAANYIDDAEKD